MVPTHRGRFRLPTDPTSRRSRTIRLAPLAVLSLLLTLGTLPAQAAPSATRLPGTGGAPTSTYLVEATTGAAATRAARLVSRAGGEVGWRYTRVLEGFSAALTAPQAKALRAVAGITTVSADRKIIANPCLGCPPEQLQRESVQNWGLLRIGSDGPVTLEPQEPQGPIYRYDSDGEGVTAVVLDSGVNPGGELAGRVVGGYDFVGRDANPADCTGHGTQVAEVVAGSTTGVADRTRIVPLRVFSCGNAGWWSTVVAALDWTVKHRSGPTVVNLSGAGLAYGPGDRAVKAVIAAGIPVVVSAGNVADNACRYSPARVPGAVTVAASTIADARAPRSNTGRCVDLFAPGADIVTSTGTVTGTSFAAAHTTGVVARYLENHPDARPSAVTSYLVAASGKNRLTGVGTAPNRLLRVPDAVPPGPLNDVAWTVDDDANSLTVTFTPPTDLGSGKLLSYGACFTSPDAPIQLPGPACTYTEDLSARSITLADLFADTHYEVYAFAVTKAGTGAFATTSLDLGSDPPSPPQVQPAYELDSGGIVVLITSNDPPWAPTAEYTVTRTGGVDIWGQTTATQVTTGDRVFFGGLVGGESYTFTVVARNSAGSSEPVVVGPVEYPVVDPPGQPG